MLVRLPANVSWDELVSAGYVGLIEAVDRYEEDRCASFNTFASPRIRGAMLDSLREFDLLPRSMREKVNRLESAQEQWRREHGSEPNDKAMADILHTTIQDIWKIQRYMFQADVLYADAPSYNDGAPQDPILDRLIDRTAITAEARVELQESREDIRRVFDSLPERLRLVIVLYYVEELTMKEIATVMSLTVGRISQLHSKAIERLREQLDSHTQIEPHTLAIIFGDDE